MSLEWNPLPFGQDGPPYDGEMVLLAVPDWLTENTINFKRPYSLHLAVWDVDDKRWVTNDLNELTGETRWFRADEPAMWAHITKPTLQSAN